MSVTVAILGILAAIALTTLSEFGRRAAPQTAAFDLSATLSSARARALQRNTDVWFVLYPERTKAGGTAPGAYFVFEDPDQTLAASYSGAAFDPLATPPGRIRLVESVFLEDYGARHVGFCVNGSVAYPEPYASRTPGACSFCGGTGANRRGAIVFRAEGGARFLDHAGIAVPSATGPAGNSATLALCSSEAKRPQNFLMAVSGLTGFVGVFKP